MVRRFQVLTVVAVLVACRAGPQPKPERIEPFPLNLSSVATTPEHVIWLQKDGSFEAYRRPELTPDAGLSRALSRPGMVALASADRDLWATDGEGVFHWGGGWERRFEVKDPASALVGMVVVQGRPVLVFEKEVRDVARARTYPVPKLGGQLDIEHLRPLAMLVQGSRLWVGTGQGEWGGHLVCLELDAGRWVHFYDPLHYVTGITELGGKLVASWAMSHFFARSVIRVHRPDAEVDSELLPTLDDSYVQEVFADGGRLVALNEWTLSEVTGGKLVPVTELQPQRYSQEGNAIGVAPAIVRIERLDPETLLLVHADEGPLLLRGGKLVPPR